MFLDFFFFRFSFCSFYILSIWYSFFFFFFFFCLRTPIYTNIYLSNESKGKMPKSKSSTSIPP